MYSLYIDSRHIKHYGKWQMSTFEQVLTYIFKFLFENKYWALDRLSMPFWDLSGASNMFCNIEGFKYFVIFVGNAHLKISFPSSFTPLKWSEPKQIVDPSHEIFKV